MGAFGVSPKPSGTGKLAAAPATTFQFPKSCCLRCLSFTLCSLSAIRPLPTFDTSAPCLRVVFLTNPREIAPSAARLHDFPAPRDSSCQLPSALKPSQIRHLRNPILSEALTFSVTRASQIATVSVPDTRRTPLMQFWSSSTPMRSYLAFEDRTQTALESSQCQNTGTLV
jgi:hypothetical protein